MTESRISESEAFGTDGHVSDLVLSLLADGEDGLVPERATEHVDECAACTERLAEFVLLSLAVGEELHELSRAPVAPPFPWRAFILAACLAALGTVVRSGFFERGLLGVVQAGQELALVLRGLWTAIPLFGKQLDDALLALSLLSTLVCLFGGWLVTRLFAPQSLEGHAG